MCVYKKLLSVQTTLKAPKNQKNNFGNYKYRSCEDILEAVKPILKENNATIIVSDEIVLIGERYYIKANVSFIDIETGEAVNVSALAREEENKKGMDSSQVSGASSSYARKYALNGLFAIDDTKDADTDEYKKQSDTKAKSEEKKEYKPSDDVIVDLTLLGITLDQVIAVLNSKRLEVNEENVKAIIEATKQKRAKGNK